MKLPLVLVALLSAALEYGALSDYKITVLRPDATEGLVRPEYRPTRELVGKSIAAMFGPVSEVRVEMEDINTTAVDRGPEKLEQKIRDRIDRVTCLGRDSEVAWHKAPWARGYLLFKNGRIVPVEIMLSGIIVGDWLFAENASQEP
jgi:hypothetical protein